jgi:uncharacterized protein with HEPN domain
MAASKNPLVRLRHILDEAQAIRTTTSSLKFEAFRGSWVVRRAVEHGFLIIAEAVKTLPDQLKNSQANIPWARIVALGNVLRHEYTEVDPSVLWRIIRDDLPRLEAAVQEMLSIFDH